MNVYNAYRFFTAHIIYLHIHIYEYEHTQKHLCCPSGLCKAVLKLILAM